jgi:Dyp-type peroxidase family
MSELERDDIQGMLLSAYGHLPFSANAMLRIDDAALARTWLAALADSITPATGKHHKRGTNLALTNTALNKLGLDTAAMGFPAAFIDGMASARRARILGDDGPSAPAQWRWGAGADAVDIALMLFADDEAALSASLADHRAAFPAAGMHEVVTLMGWRHPDGKEHFGFSDGIAQPAIRAETSSEPARRRTNRSNDVAAGEFILGYPNEYGLASDTPKLDAAADAGAILRLDAAGKRDFGRNGSYLIVRQLEQDVAKFWGFLDSCTRGPQGSDPRARERLAAKFLGRWPGGAPLVKAPQADDPALKNDNDFGFDADRDGLLCPIGAHIRRANPRDGFARDGALQSTRRSNRHRILRRGRPYGPRPADPLVDDGASRGLIFICLNADIERQFEFVHQTWLNNATFSGLENEVDPLIGSQSSGAWMTIPQEPFRRRVKGIERYVTTKGGAYCFLPGRNALRCLAKLSPATVG